MNLLGAEYASFSMQGGRAYNEDSVDLITKGAHAIAVVADGAGGHGGGDVASALCIQYYSEALEKHHQVFDSPSSLAKSLEDLNRLIVDSQSHGGEQADMRSTIAVLSLNTMSRQAVWATLHRGRHHGKEAHRHCSLRVRITRSTIPFCSGLYGVMNSCCKP